MITSTHNPKIKAILKLKKSRERKAQGLVLVEGHPEIKMALEGGTQAETLFYAPDYARHLPSPDTVMSQETIQVDTKVFDKLAYREHPDGFLAVVRPFHLELRQVQLKLNPLIVVLEAVEKPGNLGAVLRTADAAQVDAVIVCESQTDIYNPNVIRASLGTVFTNQVVITTNEEALDWLRIKGIKILATTPRASKTYYEFDLSAAIAIVIGAEHDGLTEFWLNKADERALIPRQGQIDSLNASVSAAIMVFESLRQRKSAEIS